MQAFGMQGGAVFGAVGNGRVSGPDKGTESVY